MAEIKSEKITLPKTDSLGQPIYKKVDQALTTSESNEAHFHSQMPYLGEALQAIHELPLALFRYKSTDDISDKETFGVIIERIRETEEILKKSTDVGHTFGFDETSLGKWNGETVEPSDFVKNRKKYFYSYAERQSIVHYMNTMVQSSLDHQDILSTVGVLLKAAQETQDRLLDLEVSTYGYDSPTVPGNFKGFNNKIDTPLEDQEPLDYGLNRSVSLIMRDLYGSSDINAWKTSIQENGHSAIDSISYLLDAFAYYSTRDWAIRYNGSNEDGDRTLVDGDINNDKAFIYKWASAFPEIVAEHQDEDGNWIKPNNEIIGEFVDGHYVNFEEGKKVDMDYFNKKLEVNVYDNNTESTTTTLNLFDPSVFFMVSIRKIANDFYGHDNPFSDFSIMEWFYYVITRAFYANTTNFTKENRYNPFNLNFEEIKDLIENKHTSVFDIIESISTRGFTDPWVLLEKVDTSSDNVYITDALDENSKTTYAHDDVFKIWRAQKYGFQESNRANEDKGGEYSSFIGSLVTDYTSLRDKLGFNTLFHFDDTTLVNQNITTQTTSEYVAFLTKVVDGKKPHFNIEKDEEGNIINYQWEDGHDVWKDMENLGARNTELREPDTIINRIRKLELALDNLNEMFLEDDMHRFENVREPYEDFNLGYYYGESFHDLMGYKKEYDNFAEANARETTDFIYKIGVGGEPITSTRKYLTVHEFFKDIQHLPIMSFFDKRLKTYYTAYDHFINTLAPDVYAELKHGDEEGGEIPYLSSAYVYKNDADDYIVFATYDKHYDINDEYGQHIDNAEAKIVRFTNNTNGKETHHYLVLSCSTPMEAGHEIIVRRSEAFNESDLDRKIYTKIRELVPHVDTHLIPSAANAKENLGEDTTSPASVTYDKQVYVLGAESEATFSIYESDQHPSRKLNVDSLTKVYEIYDETGQVEKNVLYGFNTEKKLLGERYNTKTGAQIDKNDFNTLKVVIFRKAAENSNDSYQPFIEYTPDKTASDYAYIVVIYDSNIYTPEPQDWVEINGDKYQYWIDEKGAEEKTNQMWPVQSEAYLQIEGSFYNSDLQKVNNEYKKFLDRDLKQFDWSISFSLDGASINPNDKVLYHQDGKFYVKSSYRTGDLYLQIKRVTAAGDVLHIETSEVRLDTYTEPSNLKEVKNMYLVHALFKNTNRQEVDTTFTYINKYNYSSEFSYVYDGTTGHYKGIKSSAQGDVIKNFGSEININDFISSSANNHEEEEFMIALSKAGFKLEFNKIRNNYNNSNFNFKRENNDGTFDLKYQNYNL